MGGAGWGSGTPRVQEEVGAPGSCPGDGDWHSTQVPSSGRRGWAFTQAIDYSKGPWPQGLMNGSAPLWEAGTHAPISLHKSAHPGWQKKSECLPGWGPPAVSCWLTWPWALPTGLRKWNQPPQWSPGAHTWVQPKAGLTGSWGRGRHAAPSSSMLSRRVGKTPGCWKASCEWRRKRALRRTWKSEKGSGRNWGGHHPLPTALSGVWELHLGEAEQTDS